MNVVIQFNIHEDVKYFCEIKYLGTKRFYYTSRLENNA